MKNSFNTSTTHIQNYITIYINWEKIWTMDCLLFGDHWPLAYKSRAHRPTGPYPYHSGHFRPSPSLSPQSQRLTAPPTFPCQKWLRNLTSITVKNDWLEDWPTLTPPQREGKREGKREEKRGKREGKEREKRKRGEEERKKGKKEKREPP